MRCTTHLSRSAIAHSEVLAAAQTFRPMRFGGYLAGFFAIAIAGRGDVTRRHEAS
jgi:hypothetical protein